MKDKLREDRHDAIAKAIADTIGHGMREKCERHADAVLVILDAEGDGGAEWRCFHCDVVFNNYQDAAIHFGVYRMQEMHTPACQIDIAEYRRMEAENKDYREEDATIHRQMRGMEIDHARALRRAEEDGYAKGLSAHPARSGVVSDEDVRDAARYRWLKKNATETTGEYGEGAQLYFGTYRNGPLELDAAIDAAIQGERHER